MAIPTLARAHLLRRLTRSLAQGHVFLEAPTGYGKTVLLQLLARQRPGAYLLRLTPADIDQAVLPVRRAPLLRDDHTRLLDEVHLLEAPRAAADFVRVATAPLRP